MENSENLNNQNSLTRKYFKVLGLILILLFPAIFYFVLTSGKHNMLSLPYFGEREPIKVMVNGKEKIAFAARDTEILYFCFKLENLKWQKNLKKK